MRKNLVPFDLSRHLLGESLPYDLFNNHGVLILQRGDRLDDPVRLARLAEMSLYRVDKDPANTALLPATNLNELAGRYAVITGSDSEFNADELTLLARDLYRLVSEHPALCVGMVWHLPLSSKARRHALFVAILSGLVALELGQGIRTQETLIRAALSMNLSSFTLQDVLDREGRPPSQEESEQLWHHPWQSWERLFRAGVRDMDWLNAVRQHHENLDQTGYPSRVGVEAITIEARILRVVDVFAALIGQRHSRSGYVPHQAMRLAFDRERGHLDGSVMLTLRRMMGRHPPGTLVKLANRETAVVTRWFRNASAPKFVVSLLQPSGGPLPIPQARDTSRRDYSIRGYTSLPMAPPALNWPDIWAQG
ncbi:MAG: HD domain-containing phosphohydrolase [Hydrogenophilaceae bacterium]